MFCACLAIVFCLAVLIGGAAVSAVDVSRYDFGLYYVLLAVVGLTAAVAVCVVRPRQGCCFRDPVWYTNCYDGVRRCLIAEHQKRRRRGKRRQRGAAVLMLHPAMELMHHMLHGIVRRDKSGGGGGGGADDDADSGRRRRRKRRNKHASANEDGLYTILETSAASHTTTTADPASVITVHECYPQSTLGPPSSIPGVGGAAGVGGGHNTLTVAQIYAGRRRVSASSEMLDDPYVFQKHDVLSQTVAEEGVSETRPSSTQD